MFRKDGKTAAGATVSQGGAPPAWFTYVATADVDATAAKISEAGGQVIWRGI
jgi:predicted enzyme related to lactoylglutathione lyase